MIADDVGVAFNRIVELRGPRLRCRRVNRQEARLVDGQRCPLDVADAFVE